MINFKKLLTDDYYAGFVNENGRYEKYGFFVSGGDVYFGEYKNGSRQGSGMYYFRNQSKFLAGRISYDSINGIGIEFQNNQAKFGYFSNGVFESGFVIDNNNLGFKSKKHLDDSLYITEDSSARFVIKHINPDNTFDIRESHNPLNLSRGWNYDLKYLSSYNSLSMRKTDVCVNKNFYGELALNQKGTFGYYDNGNNNYEAFVTSSKIIKSDSKILFKNDSWKLLLDDIIKTKATFECRNIKLVIEDELFSIILKDGYLKYEMLIDADYNVNYRKYYDECQVEAFDISFDEKKEYKKEINEHIDEELNKLIGLKKAKEQLKKIVSYVAKNKDSDINLHMAFLGNPGTGKTTFAKLIADLFYKYDVLPTNKFINGNRSSFVARYIGHTAPKTRETIESAMGGVLLIDEAYSLYAGGNKKSFGDEAIEVLIQEMENKKGKFCCILAGYKKEMLELFDRNPGFKSRIQFIIDFEDFNDEEIELILNDLLNEYKLEVESDVLDKMKNIINYKRSEPYFGNARDCRNLIEQLNMIALDRDNDNSKIILEDIDTYLNENTLKEIKIKKTQMIDKESLKIKNNKIKDIDIKESIINLYSYYNKITEKTNAIIITDDGYALAPSIKVSECIKDQSKRNTLDAYGNEIHLIDDVNYSFDNNAFSLIKLMNDNIKYPHSAIKRFKEDELGKMNLYSYSLDESNKIIKTKVELLIEEGNKRIKSKDSLIKGTGIYNNDNNSLIGIVLDNNELLTSNEILEALMK